MRGGRREKAAARAANMNPRWSRRAIRSFPFCRTAGAPSPPDRIGELRKGHPDGL